MQGYTQKCAEETRPCSLNRGADILGSSEGKTDGFTKFIPGDASDAVYGGCNGLLAKDWTIGEFIDRYLYVMPCNAW
ncbi:MAG: hypothetical protein IJS39_13745 [Synergistaceae bacterium]|nr:hypothetical protein [Synergistaceae bacterium]